MKNRLEYSQKAAPWYEDLTHNLKLVSNHEAPIVAREDRLQMALPDDVLFAPGEGELKDQDQLVLHALAQALKRVPYTDFDRRAYGHRAVAAGQPLRFQLGTVASARDVGGALSGSVSKAFRRSASAWRRSANTIRGFPTTRPSTVPPTAGSRSVFSAMSDLRLRARKSF